MIGSIHIIGSRQFGGADRFYVRLVEAFARRCFPVIAVIRPRSPVHRALNPEIPCHPVPMRNGWDLWSLWLIRRIVKRSGHPIVQTYMGRATRLTRVPKSSDIVHVARLGGYYKIDGYYRHAHAWVGNTKGICDYLIRNGLPSHRVFHIGNFVEIPGSVPEEALERFRTRHRIPEDCFILLAVGRFIPKKGFHDLLHALSLLPEKLRRRPWVCVLVGDGPEKERLQRLAAKLRLSARCRWVGWHNDPSPFYAMADLFILPSRHEPLGNVILEAWAHGLPVVSTRTEGPMELITDGENGILADPASPRDLSDKIHRLVESDPRSLESLGLCGKNKVLREHTEESIVAQYLALYQEMTR